MVKKKYFIGTSGWSYKHWEERFYPKKLSQKEWFDFYSQHFDTAEVNYSFYKWPRKKTLEKWYNQSPYNFKFTLKAPRIITHVRKIKDVENKVQDFYNLTKLLKKKMGCHLFQLPPSIILNEHNLAKLKKFVKVLDGRKDNAIEFRDKSWWNDGIYGLLKDNKVIFSIVSGLGMPEDIVFTNKTTYFRFHGVQYSTKYNTMKIKEYADKMKKSWAQKIYAYFNNDANAYSVKNAKELREMVI